MHKLLCFGGNEIISIYLLEITNYHDPDGIPLSLEGGGGKLRWKYLLYHTMAKLVKELKG